MGLVNQGCLNVQILQKDPRALVCHQIQGFLDFL